MPGQGVRPARKPAGAGSLGTRATDRRNPRRKRERALPSVAFPTFAWGRGSPLLRALVKRDPMPRHSCRGLVGPLVEMRPVPSPAGGTEGGVLGRAGLLNPIPER